MDKRIAVTGAAGFIGGHLSKSLIDHGYRVVGIDNLSAGRRENLPSGIDFRESDIRRADLSAIFRNTHTVFHLAAKNCLSDCAADPLLSHEINVEGTRRVAQTAAACGVKHFIYADTAAEYEGVPELPSRPDRVRPLSVYGRSKREGALAAAGIASEVGMAFTTLRYFNVYGPAQDWRRSVPPVMSAFALKLLRGERPTIYGDGSKSRDFIHVGDVVDFHLRLLENPVLWGGTFNLGTGKRTSVREIFEAMSRFLESQAAPLFVPDLPEEAQHTQADITATLATGWRPRVALERGLREFLGTFRASLPS